MRMLQEKQSLTASKSDLVEETLQTSENQEVVESGVNVEQAHENEENTFVGNELETVVNILEI